MCDAVGISGIYPRGLTLCRRVKVQVPGLWSNYGVEYLRKDMMLPVCPLPVCPITSLDIVLYHGLSLIFVVLFHCHHYIYCLCGSEGSTAIVVQGIHIAVLKLTSGCLPTYTLQS